MFHGMQQRNALLELFLDDPQGLFQVRVVGYHGSNVVVVTKAVTEKVRGKIHVRTLLFGFHDPQGLV